jgi:hypothetical protein
VLKYLTEEKKEEVEEEEQPKFRNPDVVTQKPNGGSIAPLWQTPKREEEKKKCT